MDLSTPRTLSASDCIEIAGKFLTFVPGYKRASGGQAESPAAARFMWVHALVRALRQGAPYGAARSWLIRQTSPVQAIAKVLAVGRLSVRHARDVFLGREVGLQT